MRFSGMGYTPTESDARTHHQARQVVRARSTPRSAALVLSIAVAFACAPADRPAEEPDSRGAPPPAAPIASAMLSGDIGTLCASCSLKVEKIVSLGNLNDPELLSERERPSVERLSTGTFIAAPSSTFSEMLLYDENGTYQGSWGRKGDGPGEFQSIYRLALLPGDSVLVVDYNHRVTVLDPSGAYVRSSRLDFMPLMVKPIGSARWVASTMSMPATPERIGYPIHVYAANGTFETVLGGDVPVIQSRPSASQRVIAANERGVWAGRPDRYELEYWTFSGERVSVIERISDWFPQRDVEGAVRFTQEPPSSWLVDLHIDDEGLLWTLSNTAALSWEPTNTTVAHIDRSRFYDTVVEVIDPAAGEILASQRFEWSAWSFTTDGLIVSFREGDYGTLVIDLWRASFTSAQEDA